MSNKPQASTTEQGTNGNLVELGAESSSVKQARDINRKIDTLEHSLDDLQTQLTEINQSVGEGLERLDDSDLDLNAKVTETYKRLGQIDQTYKALATISEEIDSEVKKLTDEISGVAEQSAAELENLQASSSAQYSQLNEQHGQLVQRINELVKHSKQTHEKLTESINNNTHALLTLERHLVDEIDVLSDETQKRDDELADKLDKAEQAIASNKASILKLQAVDTALDKRAAELEKTSRELTAHSRAHQESLKQLDARSGELAYAVEQLQVRGKKHEEQIIELQVNTSVLSRTLAALARTEKRHFGILAIVLALLALVVAGLSYYQNGVNGNEAQRVATAQSDITAINNKLQNVDTQLQQVDTRLGQVDAQVQQVDAQVQKVDDQAASLDGRLNHISPFTQFGKDNVIHGPEWLAAQPVDNYAVLLASTGSKQDLYEIAQQYNRHLRDSLAYYTVDSLRGQRYILVYGSFANQAEAASSLWRMPPYISRHRPQLTRIGDIAK